MIFDNAEVTKLVLEWQTTKDPDVMERILEGSRALVEAIVSIYDSIDREDLIQESMARLHHAVSCFKPEKQSTLHNYFTTVIRNICTTYSERQDRLYLYADDARDEYADDSYEDVLVNIQSDVKPDTDLLEELIVHNRKRFPSLPASTLDEASEFIYYELMNNECVPRLIPANMSDQLGIPKTIAIIVYQSSLVFMRIYRLKHAKVDLSDIPEFSLLYDLRAVLGDKAFEKVLLTFSGMYIRLP